MKETFTVSLLLAISTLFILACGNGDQEASVTSNTSSLETSPNSTSLPPSTDLFWMQRPNAAFDVTIQSSLEEVPLVVQFNDKSSTKYEGLGSKYEITYWEWDFGDGTTSTEQNPKHEYGEQGIYDIKLRVTDPVDRGDNATQTLYLQPPVGNIVTFPDSNLEYTVRRELGMPNGDIYESHLEHVVSIDNRYTPVDAFDDVWNPIPIVDLSGLEYCKNLTSLEIHSGVLNDISPLATLYNLTRLDLRSSQVSDISHLSNLTNLYAVELRENQITDLSPLIDNTGFGEGDYLDINGNPLNEVSMIEHVSQLRARGVYVWDEYWGMPLSWFEENKQ